MQLRQRTLWIAIGLAAVTANGLPCAFADPIGPVVQLDPGVPCEVLNPALTSAATGGYHAAWQAGADSIVDLRVDGAGNPLGAAVVTGSARYPALERSGDGVTALAWMDGSNADLDRQGYWVQLIAADGSRGAPIRLRQFNLPQFPVRMAARGTLFVAVAEYAGFIFVLPFRSDGERLPGFQWAEPPDLFRPIQPDVAIDPDGRIVLAWIDYINFGSRIGIVRARAFDLDGVPLTPLVTVDAYDFVNPLRARHPAILAMPSGFVVAWDRSPPDAAPGVYARSYAGDLQPRSAVTRIGADPGAREPDVALDAGRLLLSYATTSGTQQRARLAQLDPPDLTVQRDAELGASPANGPLVVRVASAETGRALSLWSRGDAIPVTPACTDGVFARAWSDGGLFEDGFESRAR